MDDRGTSTPGHLLDRESVALVSVIIPCYNQARFLGASIESVLAQTYPHYEIIVVDDGSADDPGRVAATYRAVRFIRQPNQGAAAARNRGWRESQGGFLVFLDGDDRLLPNALQAGYDCFDAHPDCGFVFGRGRLIGPEGEELIPNSLPVVDDAGGYEQLLAHNPIAFPAVVMFRRSAFESLGGFNHEVNGTRIDNVADYDLYLRVAERFPIRAHKDTIAECRQHGANTSSNSLMMLRSGVAVLNSQRSLIRGSPRYRTAMRKGLRRHRRHFGERLIQELRAEARSGRIGWLRLGAGLGALVRHYPQGLLANVLRKVRHTLFRRRPGRDDP